MIFTFILLIAGILGQYGHHGAQHGSGGAGGHGQHGGQHGHGSEGGHGQHGGRHHDDGQHGGQGQHGTHGHGKESKFEYINSNQTDLIPSSIRSLNVLNSVAQLNYNN